MEMKDPDKAHRDAVARKIKTLRIEDEARRQLASEKRPKRQGSFADGVLDDVDNIPAPEMLLMSLIPLLGIGFLTGKSGSYKSFLAVSWGCCIATGIPWLGREEFSVRRPLKVLYVAAEGARGVAARIRAWEAANGVSRKGKLLLYPKPVPLNNPRAAAEMIEYARDNGIEFLIIDTYHRSTPGSDENSATEFGIVFDAVAQLRDDYGCGVLFLDHSGKAGGLWPRGSSAKVNDSDYILSVTYPGERTTPDVQRTLQVSKLKDEDTTGKWHIRLADVEGHNTPIIEIGSVAPAVSKSQASPQLMGKCSQHIESNDGAPQKAIETAIGGDNKLVRSALSELEKLGYITIRSKGPGYPKLHWFVKPFIQSGGTIHHINFGSSQ